MLEAVFLALALSQERAPPVSRVEIVRAPERGLQPRGVAAGAELHVVTFVGDPAAGDLVYARSSDRGHTFTQALRVNRRPGSAVAIGNVRGPQIALGRNGRVHVAWNGKEVRDDPTKKAAPAPMLYTRLDDSGAAFEPEHDVIKNHHGLDGGGAVVAGDAGEVFVVWHAPDEKGKDEEARRIWFVASSDDGKTFGAETAASPKGSGVCPCCGLGAFALEGGLAILYRTAHGGDHRDTSLLTTADASVEFEARLLDPWKVPS